MTTQSSSPSQFTACIGLDWADGKHDICMQLAGGARFERSVIVHSPEAIDEWARALRERFGGQPIAVALELWQGPIISALTLLTTCAARAPSAMRTPNSRRRRITA